MRQTLRAAILFAAAGVGAQALEQRAPRVTGFARRAADTEALASTGTIPMSPLSDLSNVVSTSTAEVTSPLPTTYTAGASAPVSGAPSLPSSTLDIAAYPALDVTPPTDSAEVQQWLSEIDLSNVPDIPVTGTGGCSNSTNADNLANAGADGYCWWTCGQCTRASDVSFCPTQKDWGLTYDDGPSPDTPRLLTFLEDNNVKATFNIVGSRALSRPEMVQTEYMSGHQIAVHTWSHPQLTTKTNEEIVAELGWTKKVLTDITGVTPNSFRPPYGDIDDRVRYIALQMGLQAQMWTTASGNEFDTRDWEIVGGQVSAPDVYSNFETFLESAVSNLSTGFIVLEHDLFQQTVDFAVDYILPRVLSAGQLSLKPVISCLGKDLSEAYVQTSSNDTSLLETTSTMAGASGDGFASGLAAALAASTPAGSDSMASSTGSSGAAAAAASSASSGSGSGGGDSGSSSSQDSTGSATPSVASSSSYVLLFVTGATTVVALVSSFLA